MLTTDKIIAHKTNGKNLILLTQVASSYFITFGQLVHSRRGTTYKAIFQKELTEAEAALAFAELTGKSCKNEHGAECLLLEATIEASKTTTGAKVGEFNSSILLLESPKTNKIETEVTQPAEAVVSPYFPVRDIFLTTQMTMGPTR